jgi:hypothetical protein
MLGSKYREVIYINNDVKSGSDAWLKARLDLVIFYFNCFMDFLYEVVIYLIFEESQDMDKFLRFKTTQCKYYFERISNLSIKNDRRECRRLLTSRQL